MKTPWPGGIWLRALAVAVTIGAGCSAQDPAPAIEEHAQEDAGTDGAVPPTLQQRVRQLEAGINALNRRMEDAGEDLAEDVRHAVPELNDQATEVRTLLEALSRHSGDAWERFRDGAVAALDELEQAYAEATARLDE